MIVYTDPHRDWHLALQKELGDLLVEQNDLAERLTWIQRRVQYLQETISAFSKLIEQQQAHQQIERGLPEFCSQVLSRVDKPLTAPEIRQQLALAGVDISTYSNPLAVLHTTLQRLEPVQRVKYGDGQIRYSWNGLRQPIQPPPGIAPPPPYIPPVPVRPTPVIRPPKKVK